MRPSPALSQSPLCGSPEHTTSEASSSAPCSSGSSSSNNSSAGGSSSGDTSRHGRYNQQHTRRHQQRVAGVMCRSNPLRRIAVRAEKAGNSEQSLGLGDGLGMDADEPKLLEGITGWRRRWTIVGLCFVAFMLCNMDRVNMSIAVLPMAKEYLWDSTTVGLVQSSFFWGYLLTQVAGGIWADRFGGKKVLGLGVLWWSAATVMTPLAAQMGLPFLLAARALMGIGEGVAMPAMNNMLSRWVPVRERSRSLALVYSGMFTGSILGLGVSPAMIAAFNWPCVFYIFGSLGLVWYFVWQARAASTPADDEGMNPAERRYIMANTISGATVESIPWRKLLARKEVWALIICHFCHNWGTFILLTWMPTYYNQVLGLDLMHSGILSVLPWMMMAVCANVGGWIADTLIERGHSVTLVRKVMQSIGFLGPAFFLSQLSGITSIPWAVACMMGAQGLDAFSQSGLYSNHQDIAPRYSGVLLGMSNTAGVLAGVLGSLATGYILKHGSWDQVWLSAVVLYLIGTVVWNLLSSGERIFD